MTRGLLLAIPLLAGCAVPAAPFAGPRKPLSTVSYTIHGDTECIPNIRADVERRAREWGSVSRHHIRYRLMWDLTAASIWELRDEPLLVCRARLAGDLCGSTTGTVVELSTAPECDTSATALHELGHLAGIPDVADPLAVMHVSSRTTRLTAADVRACASVWLCPRPGRQPDTTTVILTIDPAIPPVEPEYPR